MFNSELKEKVNKLEESVIYLKSKIESLEKSSKKTNDYVNEQCKNKYQEMKKYIVHNFKNIKLNETMRSYCTFYKFGDVMVRKETFYYEITFKGERIFLEEDRIIYLLKLIKDLNNKGGTK